MGSVPDWIMAACAVGSLVLAIIALMKAGNAVAQVNSLTTKITTLSTELNRVSSSMKDSKIKQVNKSGSDNQFIGGNYNE